MAKVSIKPFTLGDLAKLQTKGINIEKPNVATVIELAKITLRKNFPEATEEEIDELPIELFNELAGHISRINGVEGSGDVVISRLPK